MHLKSLKALFPRVILAIYSVGVTFSVKKKKKQQFIFKLINILDVKQKQLYQAQYVKI